MITYIVATWSLWMCISFLTYLTVLDYADEAKLPRPPQRRRNAARAGSRKGLMIMPMPIPANLYIHMPLRGRSP